MNMVIHKRRRSDEEGRQRAVERLEVLDSAPEPQFDKVTSLVCAMLGVPIAAVSLIDRDRQWFKSIQGLEIQEGPRAASFCERTVQTNQVVNIGDLTQDISFCENIYVIEQPKVRAYLGVPLVTHDGYAVGSLCAIDYVPREFTEEQVQVLIGFADLVVSHLELRQIASVDPTTGLATRRAFIEARDNLLRETASSGAPASLICLDLDRFKSINDTHGHLIGDAVLAAVGAAVRQECPENSFCARIGGEELAVLLSGTDEKDAVSFAERLRLAIDRQTLPEIPGLLFTASLGVAQHQAGQSADAWLAAADAAMYRAKICGRNRVVAAN